MNAVPPEGNGEERGHLAGLDGPPSPVRWVLVAVPAVIFLVGLGFLLAGGTRTALPPSTEYRPSTLDEFMPPPDAGSAPATDPQSQFSAARAVQLIAQSSAEDGAIVFKRCAACHRSEKDARHGVGPNLWDVVGKPWGFQADYAYSPALGNTTGLWSYQALAAFLHDPRAFAPGNWMAFRGMTKEQDVAAVIAYLRTRSDDPMPLP